MSENKLSLTFVLPGRIIMSSQECEKNPKENYIVQKFVVPNKGNSKDKKSPVKTIYVQTRKTKNASQHLNISKEAYLNLLDTPVDIKFSRLVKTKKGLKRAWDLLSNQEKLKHHFDLMANDFHAISYSYEVLDD